VTEGRDVALPGGRLPGAVVVVDVLAAAKAGALISAPATTSPKMAPHDLAARPGAPWVEIFVEKGIPGTHVRKAQADRPSPPADGS
jgi:hypothetical protein